MSYGTTMRNVPVCPWGSLSWQNGRADRNRIWHRDVMNSGEW